MIFTLFSFKGGLGRSMAVANLAVLWRRRGYRVLAVDWDLEAPGLESFFFEGDPEKIAEVRALPGVIDLLEGYQKLATAHGKIRDVDFDDSGGEGSWLPDLDRHLVEVLPADERGPRLLLLPAGCREGGLSGYARRVRSFRWYDLLEYHDGGLFYEWLRQQLLARADVVLIDARTGLSEMGGVCTHELADFVVLLTGPNPQSIEGTAAVARQLRAAGRMPLRADRPLEMLVVPSRIDFARETDYHGTLQRHLGGVFPGVDFADGARKSLEVPYVAKYAAREPILIGDREGTRIEDAYRALTHHVETKALDRFEIVLAAAEADAEPRAELATALVDHDFFCWWDHQVGREPAYRLGRIRSRLRRSRVMVVLWSSHAAGEPILRPVVDEFLRAGPEARSGPRAIYLHRLSEEPVPPWLEAVADREIAGPAELLERLGADTPRLGLVSYFRALAIRSQHVELPILGRAARGTEGGPPSYLPVQELFVDRRLRVEVAEDGGPARGEGDRGLRWLLAQERVQLLGEPGAGKTTLLRYLAFRFAQLQLNRDDEVLSRFGLTERLLPIYLHLPDLQGLRRSPRIRVQDWLELLREHLAEGGAQLDAARVDQMLRRGGILLLADALDEVDDQDDQRWLADSLLALADYRPGGVDHGLANRFILATRPGAARVRPGFVSATLRPFATEEVGDFLDRWARLYGGEADGPGHVEQLRDFLGNPEIEGLQSNPLLLTILVSLYTHKGIQPQTLADVYRHIVDRLIDRRRSQLEEWGKPEAIRDYLVALAERSWREGGRRPGDASLGADVAVETLREAAREVAGQGLDWEAAATLFEALDSHVGVYEIRRDDEAGGGDERRDRTRPGGGSVPRRMHFRYDQLFEYLVAAGAVRREDLHSEDPAGFLLDQPPGPSWDRVVDLTAGALGLAPGGTVRLRRFLQGMADVAKQPGSAGVERAVAFLARFAASAPEEWTALSDEALGQVLALLEHADPAVPRARRVAIARGLVRDGASDPRLTDRRRWCEIAGGSFWRGSEDQSARADERPLERVELEYDFRIGRWPVTVEEFARFAVEYQGYDQEKYWSRGGLRWLAARRGEDGVGKIVEEVAGRCRERGNHPMTGVTWWEAEAYCAWRTAELACAGHLDSGQCVRLPTEDEWEKAARGGLTVAGRENPSPQRAFPWGDAFEAERLNTVIGREAKDPTPVGTTPVGCFPAGNGPYGSWDQAGNVHEWCLDAYRAARGRPPAGSRGAPESPVDDAPRSLRGGSYKNLNPRRLQVTARASEHPGSRDSDKAIGFRCVLAPAAVSPERS